MTNTPLEIKLYDALRRIAKDYQSSEQIKRRGVKDWGLDDPCEALEYAYENLQAEAANAIKGLRIKRS